MLSFDWLLKPAALQQSNITKQPDEAQAYRLLSPVTE